MVSVRPRACAFEGEVVESYVMFVTAISRSLRERPSRGRPRATRDLGPTAGRCPLPRRSTRRGRSHGACEGGSLQWIGSSSCSHRLYEVSIEDPDFLRSAERGECRSRPASSTPLTLAGSFPESSLPSHMVIFMLRGWCVNLSIRCGILCTSTKYMMRNTVHNEATCGPVAPRWVLRKKTRTPLFGQRVRMGPRKPGTKPTMTNANAIENGSVAATENDGCPVCGSPLQCVERRSPTGATASPCGCDISTRPVSELERGVTN